MRLRRCLPLATALLAACSDSTAPDSQATSLRFAELAREAWANGNPNRAVAFDAASDILARGGGIRELPVTLDGGTSNWRAVGWEAATVLPPVQSAYIAPLRVLVAWRGPEANTVLFAVLWGDEGEFGQVDDPTPIHHAGTALLSEGPHRVWMADGGEFGMTLLAESLPCSTAGLRAHSGVELTCRRARFEALLGADFAPLIPPGVVAGSSDFATGRRSVSLHGEVTGLRLVMHCGLDPSSCLARMPFPES